MMEISIARQIFQLLTQGFTTEQANKLLQIRLEYQKQNHGIWKGNT